MGTIDSIDEHAPDSDVHADSSRRPVRAPGVALLLGVAVVLGFLTAQLMAATGLTVAFGDTTVEGDISMSDALVLSAIQAVGIASVVLLVLSGVSTWRRIGVVRERRSFDVGWRALLPVGLLVIAPTFGAALFSDDPVVNPGVSPGLMAVLVVLAVLIGVNEELWFRGLLFDQLHAARMPWFTIIASAVLFGLPHAGNTTAALLNAVAVTLAVGIPFAIVRLRTGSLWALIAWHALIDIWAFVHTASVVAQGSPSLAESLLALTLPALVAVGYLVWFRRSPVVLA